MRAHPSALAAALLCCATIMPFPASASTIVVPPVTITQLTHQTYFGSGGQFLGVSDTITIPGSGYTSSGFTTTEATGDVIVVRIQPPPGKKFSVHSPASGSGDFNFYLYWQAAGDVGSYVEPHSMTFENLVGVAPTETYSNVRLGDNHHVIIVQKQMVFATAFEFTALVFQITASHFAPVITQTYGPVQSYSAPSFGADGITSGPQEPILEIVDQAVPALHSTWGAIRALYR